MSAKQKVLVALSGGIDSAVTAALLMEQGFEVVGVYMQLLPGSAAGSADEGAALVAQELGIEFYSLDCRAQFADKVIDNFCHEYRCGRTPNPCVLCNRYLKFGRLLDFADQLGIEYLATGHYAMVDRTGAYPVLRRGKDRLKDQSYFLFTLNAEQLGRVIFPLADLTKQEVQQIAQIWNLSARHRGESQDICFIPDNDYVSFLENQHLTLAGSGAIVHVNGEQLGQHHGSYRYTIGQRRGLGIAWSEPLYVVAIDAVNNRVLVGERHYLQTTTLRVEDVLWTQPQENFPLRVDCRIRYRHREAMASVTLVAEHQVEVVFDQPQTGVTPGQSAVFYQDDCVIGGGWIK